MRARILLPLLALVLVPFATARAGGAREPYIVQDGIAFGVYANGDWLAFSPANQPTAEKEKVDPGPVPSKDRSFMIWTKTCKPGQVVRFERKVEFLGRPLTLGGFTQTGMDVASWDIFFNGTKVAHLLKRVQPIFTEADRKLIKLGDNRIRYEVKLSNAAKACTEDARPGRRGVWFSLTGTNATDLTVNKPARKNVLHHGTEYLQPITITNRGRALATDAVLTITMASHVGCLKFNPDNTCKRWMFNIDVPVSDLNCRHVTGSDPNDRRVMECRIKDLGPQAALDVQVRMAYTAATPDWAMQENRLTWEVKVSPGAVGESDPGNNTGEVHVTYCPYGTRANGCKPKP